MNLHITDHALQRFMQWSDDRMSPKNAKSKLRAIIWRAKPAKARRLDDGRVVLFPKGVMFCDDWALIHNEEKLVTIYKRGESIA